jgi:signal transduction histidine kinase
LAAAARGVLRRAHEVSAGKDGAAARRLTELALAGGDAAMAREMAQQLVKREPGAAAHVLLGRAQLLAGAHDPARLAFARGLEAAGTAHLLRAQAHLGLAAVAASVGDRNGAGANAMGALGEIILHVGAPGASNAEIDAAVAHADEAIVRGVAAGRTADVIEAVEALRPGPGRELLVALTLAARQARGDGDVSDGEIEAALERELGYRPESRATRALLVERRLRRRYRDGGARAAAIEDLEKLEVELGLAAVTPGEQTERARVYFLLGAACEDDPARAADAERWYRQALALRPGNAATVARLARLVLARGDHEGARAAIEQALRLDPDDRVAWRGAARVAAAAPAADAAEVLVAALGAASPGEATQAVDRLIAAAAEVARGDVLSGVHARGHRLKNLLGIIGARARSARKAAGTGGDDLGERLRDLEGEITRLYDEWATYLRSLQSPGASVIEMVPVGALVEEVAAAAAARTTAQIDVTIDSGLPDLRGDRMLLREALLNVVNNAAEACAAAGRVAVAARAVRSAGVAVVEIEVADDGPGIARADLARVFVPGFTTKESGSGVGLAIAEQVMAAHHGRILLDSEVGRGTRVTLVLPADLGGFAGLATLVGERSGGGGTE